MLLLRGESQSRGTWLRIGEGVIYVLSSKYSNGRNRYATNNNLGPRIID